MKKHPRATVRTPQPPALITNEALRESIGGVPLAWKLRALLLKLKAAEHCMFIVDAIIQQVADKGDTRLAAGYEVLRDSIRDLDHLRRVVAECEVTSTRVRGGGR